MARTGTIFGEIKLTSWTHYAVTKYGRQFRVKKLSQFFNILYQTFSINIETHWQNVENESSCVEAFV